MVLLIFKASNFYMNFFQIPENYNDDDGHDSKKTIISIAFIWLLLIKTRIVISLNNFYINFGFLKNKISSLPKKMFVPKLAFFIFNLENILIFYLNTQN